jgi:FkbM family methyltransferase
VDDISKSKSVRGRIKEIPIVGACAVVVNQILTSSLNPIRKLLQRLRTNANYWRFRRHVARLSRHEEDPLFVKVGANDGVTLDPCTDILLRDPAWRGLLIEPVPYLFDRLKLNFPNTNRFILEQLAIGPRGKATFYFLDPSAKKQFADLPECFDQLGSFNKSHITNHFGAELSAYVREMIVDVEPLEDVLKRHNVSKIQLLHIDTEGYDYKVLTTLNFELVKPLAIFIEYRHLVPDEHASLLRLFRDNQYEVYDCDADYFAILKN